MKSRSLFMTILAASFAFAACDTGQGGDPNDGKPVLPEFEFPFYEQFPLEAGNLVADASEVGVTIEIKSVQDQNFVFELRPGPMVQSFKFDVYPLANLYNTILNSRNSGSLVEGDPIEVNELMREMLLANEAGGFSISVNDYDNEEDFLQIEYDWMKTEFSANCPVIPDCGYIIAVVASADPEISSANQEELSLCYVHTTSRPLVGDPQVEIEVYTGYRVFGVTHHLDSDAAGVYYFGGLKSEIDEYIDTFGDALFRDFIRTVDHSPVAADDEIGLTYSKDYGQEADYRIQSTTCAVAFDANMTPQTDYARSDFSLLEMPDEDEQDLVTPTVTIIEDRVASGYFEFYVEMPKECGTIFYTFYTEKQKQELEAASETKRKLEAIRLMKEGDGEHNPNFVWNKEAPEGEKAAGSASGRMLMTGFSDNFAPGTTMYVGYVGRNGYLTPGPLTFSDPIHLDPRNYQSYENCKVKDLRIWADKVTRTSFRQNISYDPSTVSMIHTQWIPDMIDISEDATEKWVPWEEALGVTLDSPWTEWADLIFDVTGDKFRANRMLNINHWPVRADGTDGFEWFDMRTATDYVLFVCAEDFDGNISPVEFFQVRTKAVQIGPDPTVNMELKEVEGEWSVVFTVDHDVEYFKYCVTENVADLKITGATQSSLNNIAESGISYETWVDAIYEWATNGLQTNYETVSFEFSGSETRIAACLAVGKNEAGEPTYNLFHLICKDGKVQTLEEIFGINE